MLVIPQLSWFLKCLDRQWISFILWQTFVEDPVGIVFLLGLRDSADSRHTKIREKESPCSQEALFVGIDVNMCNYNLCDWCYNVGVRR